jgi:endoglucanase
VGNSITHNGEFHHNILLYHITRFPEQPVSFYNCGVSGDVTGGVLNRMDEDILVHQPTHAVIMLGMNDVNRSLYGLKPTFNADTLRLREEAISIYKVNLAKIVNIFLSKNIKVIMEKPTIFDQTAVLPIANNFGVNDALKTCADYIGMLAEKYKLPTVDYWTIMSQINRKMQKKDPSATITGPDRVHPASGGHLVMAYEFLKSERAPQYVSKIVIDKSTELSSKKSLNCEIRSVSKRKDGVTFTVLENALPFPVIETQRKGLEMVPFMNELDMELLNVQDLKSGQYQLSIDGKIIGVFSAEKFKEGINMAEYKDTPQYQQAMKVRSKLEELWLMEAALRNIKYIEYNQYFKTCPDNKNLAVLKIYVDSLFMVKNTNSYLKSQFGKYMTNKPKQREFEETSEIMRSEVYKTAHPSDHQFIITTVQSNIH